MLIGQRLRTLRDEKNFTQGDIEKRTGLLRCYISRVENGATVPSVSTLGKMAKALEVPMYKLFFDGKPQGLKLSKAQAREGQTAANDSATLEPFRKWIRRIKPADLRLLLFMAQKMYQERERRTRKTKS
jgi:transcriptional regulator with XRE-family HTH domain